MMLVVRLAAVLAVLSFASSAQAGAIKVKPGNDVQDVISTQASAGDTLLFGPGTCTLNLDIPPGLDGLTLRGAGRVSIDAHTSLNGIPEGIRVRSDGVTVS